MVLSTAPGFNRLLPSLPTVLGYYGPTFPLPDSVLWTDTPLVVIIHGPPLTLEFLPPDVFRRHQILYLVSSNVLLPLLPFRCVISHCDAGGVLQGSWCFASNQPFGQPIPTPRRFPHQVIKCTITTKCIIPEGCPILDALDEWCPLDCYRFPVRCPTVYGENYPVTRWLTRGELLVIFDTPSAAIPALMRGSLHQPVTAAEVGDHPYLSEVPLKVLHKVYEMWSDVPYSIEPNPTPLDLHPIWEFPGVMYNEGRAFEVEAAYHQAVKSDDAQVPKHLWDNRIWGAGQHREEQLHAFTTRYKKCPLA
jgi:hypothetical protein